MQTLLHLIPPPPLPRLPHSGKGSCVLQFTIHNRSKSSVERRENKNTSLPFLPTDWSLFPGQHPQNYNEEVCETVKEKRLGLSHSREKRFLPPTAAGFSLPGRATLSTRSQRKDSQLIDSTQILRMGLRPTVLQAPLSLALKGKINITEKPKQSTSHSSVPQTPRHLFIPLTLLL